MLSLPAFLRSPVPRLLFVLLLAGGAFEPTDVDAASSSSPQSGVQAASDQDVNAVTQWNKILLAIVRTPNAQPATVHATHSFAIMHGAIYDAVNAIDGSHTVYRIRVADASPSASKDAAASSAAHGVLIALYPAFRSVLDTDLAQSLAAIPDGQDKDEGVRIGATVASRMLQLRANDGANAQPIAYVFGTAPGDYQSTPPNFPPQPQFTHWSHVKPFTLPRADQFRPRFPPPLRSDKYADDFNEVKSLGIANSATATADQALTGRFWNGAIQNYWNEIAQTASAAHQLSTAQSARLFALLNLSFADSVIAFYDAKYAYNLWRPVTAIRAAGTDDNPDTLADPNWLPEAGKTAPDPSYPGAHAVISAAAAEVLTSFFEADHFEFDVTSEVLPGVQRSFTSFSAASEEATLSRIFAGQHFRFDLTAGRRLGRQVADFIVVNFLTDHERDAN
jgi:PAP2 superfamily